MLINERDSVVFSELLLGLFCRMKPIGLLSFKPLWIKRAKVKLKA
jgi:hypothetical protein